MGHSEKNVVFHNHNLTLHSKPAPPARRPRSVKKKTAETLNLKYYALCLFTSQSTGITFDLTVNNQLVTILSSNLVALLTAYFYHKYKK